MSRAQPYRQRIPVHIIQLLDVASRITLFLVGQSGPLCFTFKDRLDNKVKTSIGSQIQCSCGAHRSDHCIHSLYVLLKIFKMSVDNPLIWQAAYVDSQLSDIVSGKHTVAQVRRPRPTFENIPEMRQPQLPSEFYRKKQVKMEVVAKVERMKLDEESVCPICQETMSADTCLSYCRVKCGNNFHLECLKVWAKHRHNEESNITCPMCRTKMGQNFLYEIQQQQKQYARKEIQKVRLDFDCAGCGVKKIPNYPHKCLLCTNYELCAPCYAANKHIKHPFIKRDDYGRWRGAEERRESELKIKNFIEGKKKERYNQQILKRLRKIEEDPNKLLDFVASSYPYVSKYISENIDPYKPLDYNPGETRCQKCHSTKMIFLRRLTCGHYIDHQCLKACILAGKFYCQEDGSLILRGYQNLLKREKELSIQKDHKIINIPVEFDPRHLDEDYNFSMGRVEQESNLTEILSSRRSDSRHEVQMRNRLASNLIRDSPRESSRSTSRERQPVQVNPPRLPQRDSPREFSREQPPSTTSRVANRQPQRQRPPIPKPSRQIRIRHVGISQSQKNKHERERPTQKRRRESVQQMLEALIGRKLK